MEPRARRLVRVEIVMLLVGEARVLETGLWVLVTWVDLLQAISVVMRGLIEEGEEVEAITTCVAHLVPDRERNTDITHRLPSPVT